MAENHSTRRKFLQFLGLSAGSTLAGGSALGHFTDRESILKLSSSQQEFMIRYGQWMDEFIEVIRKQKSEPDNSENKRKIMALAEQAEKFNPELSEFMKDETFSMIYKASIQRMSNEI